MAKVLEIVTAAATPMSATEVAEALGASRPTAQRCLVELAKNELSSSTSPTGRPDAPNTATGPARGRPRRSPATVDGDGAPAPQPDGGPGLRVDQRRSAGTGSSSPVRPPIHASDRANASDAIAHEWPPGSSHSSTATDDRAAAATISACGR